VGTPFGTAGFNSRLPDVGGRRSFWELVEAQVKGTTGTYFGRASIEPIHPSAWTRSSQKFGFRWSRNFACTKFYEIRNA
jgi:hypothetical protein